MSGAREHRTSWPCRAAAGAAALALALLAVGSAQADGSVVDSGWGDRGFVQTNAGEALWVPVTLRPGPRGRLDAPLMTEFLGGIGNTLRTGPNGTVARLDVPFAPPGERITQPGAAAPLPDGRTVTTANRTVDGGADGTGFGVMALKADGRIDTAFGAAGLAMAPALDTLGQSTSVAFTSRGVLAAGRTAQAGDIAIVRFSLAGALDAAFGADGVETVPVPGYEAIGPAFVTTFPDGRFAVAGTVARGGVGVQRVAVAWFSATGIREGPAALARLAPGAEASAVCGATASLGKLVIVGSLSTGLSTDRCPEDVAGTLRVARLNADGTPDLSFNRTGFQAVSFGAAFAGAFPGGAGFPWSASPPRDRSLALPVFAGPDGRIVIGGALPGSGAIALTRLRADGSLDGSFGGAGRACVRVPRYLGQPLDGGAHVIAPGPAGTVYAATANILVGGDDSIVTLMRLRAASRRTLPCAAVRLDGAAAQVGGVLTVRSRVSLAVARTRTVPAPAEPSGVRTVRSPVGTVTLGTLRAGAFRRTWNLRVGGRRLARGTYQLTFQARPAGTRRTAVAPAQDVTIPRPAP